MRYEERREGVKDGIYVCLDYSVVGKVQMQWRGVSQSRVGLEEKQSEMPRVGVGQEIQEVGES